MRDKRMGFLSRFGWRATLCVVLFVASASLRPLAETAATDWQTPVVTPAAMAEYRRKLEEYTRIHEKYEKDAAIYWNAIAEKRRTRIGKEAYPVDSG